VTQITDRLGDIHRRVTQALLRVGRSEDDAIVVAVAKQQPVAAIREAIAAGQRHIGESFASEAIRKQEELGAADAVWHFLGQVQANKTRDIAARFDWVHSIDRFKIARRLSEQRDPSGPPLNVLLQVNQAREPQKGGVPPEEVEPLATEIAMLPNLRLRGLMTIPPVAGDAAQRRSYFAALRRLEDELIADGARFDTLSMGMSDDFELALEEGSTCVRIGTAIFGPRR